jgi:hypothetical protein
MPDARFVREFDEQLIIAQTAVGVGELWQTADGKAAYFLGGSNGRTAGSSGDTLTFRSWGKVVVPLTPSITILDGGRVYWDHSANLAHFKKNGDRDFYIGRAVGDTSSGLVEVDLNIDPSYDIDLLKHPANTIPVGTFAAGGFGYPLSLGSVTLSLTSTNEAQKVDLFSVETFSPSANAIIEIAFRVADDGASTAADFNLGVANASHATDADAIAEHVFFHFDENNTNILAQSKDGSTTVAATDTTKDYVLGAAINSRHELWIDMRNMADIQLYVDGVNVLPATVFNLGAAVGPLLLLAHLEKTSSTDIYIAAVDWFRARFMEQ